MDPKKLRARPGAVWKLAREQHGVVSRRQLLELGLGSDAIRNRIERGRLHPVWRGIYAVGRPQLTRRGRWMAAVLSCGPQAMLSHMSAAALWGIGREPKPRDGRPPIDITVPAHVLRRREGVRLHRRTRLAPEDVTSREGIPVTAPARTLIDLGTCLDAGQLETAINQADKLDLIDPEALRAAVDRYASCEGVAALRSILDRRTFALTDSELERRFLRLVRRAGVPTPLTGRRVNGFKVDFYWPERGLVVETDGLRYHRTAAQQATDRLRDQAHTAAGLTPLRFTHAQVRFEPDRVTETLITVWRRLISPPHRG